MCSGTVLIMDYFSKKMKIVKVRPIMAMSKKELVTDYRPISVLPCLSKILKRTVYNRSYSYFNQNGKQFGFKMHHSTNHALAELVDSIFDSFNYFLTEVSII